MMTKENAGRIIYKNTKGGYRNGGTKGFTKALDNVYTLLRRHGFDHLEAWQLIKEFTYLDWVDKYYYRRTPYFQSLKAHDGLVYEADYPPENQSTVINAKIGGDHLNGCYECGFFVAIEDYGYITVLDGNEVVNHYIESDPRTVILSRDSFSWERKHGVHYF